jgi:hypothetical protein
MKISLEQKEILQLVIEERIKLALENPRYLLSGLQEKSFKSILFKIHEEKITLNKDEAICLAHLTAEIIRNKNLQLKNWVLKDWLNVPEKIKKRLLVNDTLLDILQQVKHYIKDIFHYNIEYRNKNVFETIEKLKNSQLILLSTIEDPYKICFIYNLQEYFVIELKIGFIIENMTFHRIEDYPIIRKSFESELNKRQAYEIIAKCTSSIYPKEYIDFIIEILK